MKRDFLIFAIISGTGWVIDVLLTVMLVQFGLEPFIANYVGATTSVTFVYFVSRWMLFETQTFGSVTDYGIYILWQAIAIAIGSAMVALGAYGLEPLATTHADGVTLPLSQQPSEPLAVATAVAKVLITPISLTANFFFMKWLTQRKKKAPKQRALKDQA